ncbi:polysaccharide biosynthesis/export family protein [Novosphingobium mangrovi (ex Huang et al. 2023)]|uniref:Polysaccharide export protein n=1 Tax=Novosphingobium mangrovi (ex Huang et al. 2023) TaxID=2976432 RepID=A0ABT2HZV6_9SPHN|nr:polysaccharide biosynthesis/export family protein [Novosphingobium mangrovi (ex Huang et al. 2023)]MCT2398078.1 polysaccharide export protein [Novosphingobium mangrovi (ex Huang et al. 2023)]
MLSSRRSLGLATLFANLALVAGCTSVTENPNLPVGQAAYDVIPATVEAPTAYTIDPADSVSVNVFGEPDLTFDKLLVDNAGFIQMPLIGQIKAAGQTPAEVSGEIATLLGRQYLVDPQVTVSVVEAAPRYVSVEGEVNKPGVYEIDYDTTLLSAIARAESPTYTAKLSEVVIFRTINGQRMAGRFNLKDIRGGVSPDPIVKDGDIVMIGYSGKRGLWQDILKAAPIFNAFAVVSRNF